MKNGRYLLCFLFVFIFVGCATQESGREIASQDQTVKLTVLELSESNRQQYIELEIEVTNESELILLELVFENDSYYKLNAVKEGRFIVFKGWVPFLFDSSKTRLHVKDEFIDLTLPLTE